MNKRLLLVTAIVSFGSLAPAFADTTFTETTIDPISTSNTTTTTTVQESVPVVVPSTPVFVTPAATNQTVVVKDNRAKRHLLRLGLPGLFHVNVL